MKRYQDCKNWGCKLCELTLEVRRDHWSAFPRTDEDMQKLPSICEKCSNYEREVGQL
jgi:hypothetical protein